MILSSLHQGNQVGELVSAGWTNDSHDMYISSMEASFVQQLRIRSSRQLQHYHAHAPGRSITHVGGHGLKALQEGASDELRSETNVSRLRDVGVRGLPEDPWARRFRPHKDYSGVNRRGDVVCASADDGESGTDTVHKTYRTYGREVGIFAGENLVGKSSGCYTFLSCLQIASFCICFLHFDTSSLLLFSVRSLLV